MRAICTGKKRDESFLQKSSVNVFTGGEGFARRKRARPLWRAGGRTRAGGRALCNGEQTMVQPNNVFRLSISAVSKTVSIFLIGFHLSRNERRSAVLTKIRRRYHRHVFMENDIKNIYKRICNLLAPDCIAIISGPPTDDRGTYRK